MPSVGGGGELAVSVGLTDLFWLGLGGGLTGLAQGPFRGHGLGHIALLFDVFRTVPFVELGFGLDVYDGRSSPLLRLSAGADYLLDPDWALGVALRYQPALGEETEHLFDLGLRLVLRLPD